MSLIVIAVAVGLMVLGLFGWRRWLVVQNSPDGERYRRRQMQGALVPVVDEYDEHDAAGSGQRPSAHPRDEG